MLHWNRVRDDYHDYREQIHTKNYQKHMTAEIHTIAVRKIFAINPSIIREKVELFFYRRFKKVMLIPRCLSKFRWSLPLIFGSWLPSNQTLDC